MVGFIGALVRLREDQKIEEERISSQGSQERNQGEAESNKRSRALKSIERFRPKVFNYLVCLSQTSHDITSQTLNF